MIEIYIKTDGKEILDRFDEVDCTLQEAAVIILRLEQIKQELISKKFDSKYEITKDYDEDEED